MDKKIIEEATEMVKNIPGSDSWVLTPIEVTEEKELAPYPAIEYDVLFDGALNKLIRNVNTRLEQGRQTEWGIQVVQSGVWTRFYQSMVRRNVDLSPNQEENVDDWNGE